jgi:hypothetical protein
MQSTRATHAADLEHADDAKLVDLARRGDAAAFDAIMKRYDRRLYRTARGIMRNGKADFPLPRLLSGRSA